MVGESAGSIYVTIDGDASPLLAKYAQAETASRAAGQRIASGLGSGLSSASGLVDQFGRAVSSGIERPVISATPAVQTITREIRTMGQAAESTVPQMAAASGAIRTAFGEQSIRAVERFVTMIPGVGAVLQAAFPIIGALALVETLTRAIGKSEALTAAEKELKTQTEATDQAFVEMAQHIDNVNAQYLGKKFGPAAGAKGEEDAARARLADLNKDVQKQKDELGKLATEAQGKILQRPTGGSVIQEEYAPKFAAQGEKIAQAQAKVADGEKDLQLAIFNTGQAALSQKGALSAAYVALEEARLQHQLELNKAYSAEEIQQARSAADQRIAAMTGEYDRVVATGAAEVAEARAKQQAITDALAGEVPKRIALIRAAGAAEAAGKPESEQHRIGAQTQTKIEGVQAGADKQSTDAQTSVVAAQDKATLSLIELNERLANTLRTGVMAAYEDMGATARKVESDIQKGVVKTTEELLREAEGRASIAQAAGKAQGEVAAAQVKAQYELQGIHTLQEEITYRQRLLVIQEQEQGLELAALQAKLKAAEALEDETERSKQVLEVQRQIVALRGQSQAANVTSAGQIGTLQNQQSLRYDAGQDIKGAIMQLPNTLGNALAKGIFDHSKGQSIGKDVGQGLKQTGEQLTSKLIAEGLAKIGERVIEETGLQAAFNALFPTVQTAQTTAIVGAITASTASIVAAVAGGSGVSAAGGAAGGATGGVASSASSLGTAAATGGTSMLAPIIGGLVSGIISAAATFIGDARIVKAVNETTAAVYSLRQFSGGTGNGLTTPGTQGNSQSNSQPPPTQGFVEGILSGIFTALTGAGAIDVNVVSINPLAGVAGFVHLFGFSGGTNSAPGGWSMVGEKVPEIMHVPRGSEIIPNHAIGRFANGTAGYASHRSMSIGELHVHAHGVSNPGEFARQAVAAIPHELKRQSSKFSPYS